jgi:hypothetical protein
MNSMGVQSYVNDLNEWYDDIEEKDVSAKSTNAKSIPIPPIRNTVLQEESE